MDTMKRKIFISINLPNRVKKRLLAATEKWQGLPVKWVKEGNLHVTLFFLGYIENEIVVEICQKLQKTISNEEIFDLPFDQIELAPAKEDPKMIWLSGKPSNELLALHQKIEKVLGIFASAKKSFRPHITLGRIRKSKWEALAEKPEISEKFPLLLSVESIDVMASDFSGDGQEYALIESCELK
jgi:2'-5' RNA ligase